MKIEIEIPDKDNELLKILAGLSKMGTEELLTRMVSEGLKSVRSQLGIS